MNAYDMVMFPCQGNPNDQATTTGAANLLSFAEAGGRVFATHFSYAWLVTDAPYDARFGNVANWTIVGGYDISYGVGTLQTNFSDGATLAQWLENAGATVPGASNQIDISGAFTNVSTVIPPTQSWLTLNSDTPTQPDRQSSAADDLQRAGGRARFQPVRARVLQRLSCDPRAPDTGEIYPRNAPATTIRRTR